MTDTRETTHRRDQGHNYKGLSIHAAPGVHEHAADLLGRYVQPGSKLLEVGAGSGALASRLTDAGFDVVATDLEPNQSWIHPLDLDRPHDSQAAAGTFAAVVCVETIEHLENPRAALRSMRTKLDRGGFLLLSTPNVDHPHSRLRMLLTGEPMLFGRDLYYSTGHITPLPEWLLVEHLKASGFAVSVVESAGDIGFGSKLRRAAHQVEMAFLRIVGARNHATRGDGLCLFVVASAV